MTLPEVSVSAQPDRVASGTPLLAEVLAGVMMQVPGAFAASMGRLGSPVTSFPDQAVTSVDGRAEALGTTGSPLGWRNNER